jgi:hypothetical protein
MVWRAFELTIVFAGILIRRILCFLCYFFRKESVIERGFV